MLHLFNMLILIKAKFSVSQKLRSLKRLMLANAKRLDFTNSIAENCCKVNESEGKKDVFPLSKCFSCRTDSRNWPIHTSVCIKLHAYLFEAGRVLTFVCLARYTSPAFWDKNTMYYLMRRACNLEHWFRILLKGKLRSRPLLKHKKTFRISVQQDVIWLN